jgi:anti-sigma regulatory factor (Ser/Thr protein kinase)
VKEVFKVISMDSIDELVETKEDKHRTSRRFVSSGNNEEAIWQIIFSDIKRYAPEADSLTFDVNVAFSEAYANAFKHGNKKDPDKKIYISSKVNRFGITLLIEDEGEGFIQENVPNCTDLPNRKKPSGRGIALMIAYMDKVIYNEKGNKVYLSKSFNPVTS